MQSLVSIYIHYHRSYMLGLLARSLLKCSLLFKWEENMYDGYIDLFQELVPGTSDTLKCKMVLSLPVPCYLL